MAAGRSGESRLVRFSVAHPWCVIALIAAAAALACCFVPRIEIRLDARTLVPAGHPALQASDRAAALFRRRDVVIVGVQAPDVLAPAALAEVERVTRELEARPEVDRDSIVSLAAWPLPDSDGHVRSLTRSDPGDVRRVVDQLGLRDGVLVSADGRTTVVVAEVHPGADRYALLGALRGRMATGTALAQATLGRSVARDLLRMVPAVLLLIALVLGISFRRATPALFSLAEIGVSLLLTAGVMGAAHASVFVTTLVLPVVLIAVGVSDDVHALRHFFAFRRDGSAADRITAAFSEILPAVRLTSLTTIVGLSSLALTQLEPLRVFGVYGSLAIACSTLMTFTLLPALLAIVERREQRLPAAPRLDAVMSRLLIPSPLVLAVFGAAVAASLAIVTRLRIDDSWMENIPRQSELAQTDAILNRSMAGTTTLDLAIDSGRADGLLAAETLVRVGRLARALRDTEGVGAVTSVSDEVCRLQASLRGETFAAVRDELLRGTLRFTDADVAQSMFLLSSLRRPPLDRRVDSSFRKARMTLFVRNADYVTLDRILSVAEKSGTDLFGPGAITPFGDGWVSQQTVRILVEGQLRGVPLAVLMDLLLLTIVLRSIRGAVVVIAPVVLAGLFTLALFAATGTPLGIAASMFTGIALGVGSDFAIHLYSAIKRGERPSVAAGSVVVSAAAMVLGFSVLFLSTVPTTIRMAFAISAAIAACAIGTLIVVPRFQRRPTGHGAACEAVERSIALNLMSHRSDDLLNQ